MASLKEVERVREEVTSAITLGYRDITQILEQLAGESSDVVRQVLKEYFPSIMDQYSYATGQIAAQFYEQERSLAGITAPFVAPSISLVDSGQVDSLLNWSLVPVKGFETGAIPSSMLTLATSRLAGGLSRLAMGNYAQTMADFASSDTAHVTYQRMPQAGCCAFCAMLATRGAVYESEAAATTVVGRGVEKSQTKGKRGGQGKGRRTRGNQPFGEKYHDFCRCTGVALFEGRRQEMDAAMNQYMDAYGEAYAKMHKETTLHTTVTKTPDGSIKTKHEWRNANGQKVDLNKEVIKNMREILGTK